MTIYNLFGLCGGLAFFLFGMNVMSANLEKMAGGKLEGILQRMTSNPFKSLLLGALITIAIQSSSALTVTLVGLVNSNIMSVSQTVVVIMGSNIGTTLTSWILSLNGIQSSSVVLSLLKPENSSLIIALVGVIMQMVCKSTKQKDIGRILSGFAILMYGMSLMSSSVSPLAEDPSFQSMLVAFDNPFLGLLIGVAFTGIIQSSAASIGVLQAFAMTGAISYGMAIPIVMGANIGTCVTALLSGIGVSRKAKRIPAIHISINVIGTIVWMAVYVVARYVLRMAIFGETINAFQIAVFHSIFNIGTVAFLLPFSKQLVKLAEKVVPLPAEEEEMEQKTVILDKRLLTTPGLAVAQCRERTVEMAYFARDSFLLALTMFDDYDADTEERVISLEEKLDLYEDELNDFLANISAQSLNDADNKSVTEMLHCINDFERIGDHAINMTKVAGDLRGESADFSNAARAELNVLTAAVAKILNIAVDVFEKNDTENAALIEPLEEVIDDLVKEIKNRHIHRVRTGMCSADVGITINDFLTNCERVSDHCSNVGVCIIQSRYAAFDSHSYLHTVKYGGKSSFIELYDEYRAAYHLMSVGEEASTGKKKVFDATQPDAAAGIQLPSPMPAEASH